MPTAMVTTNRRKTREVTDKMLCKSPSNKEVLFSKHFPINLPQKAGKFGDPWKLPDEIFVGVSEQKRILPETIHVKSSLAPPPVVLVETIYPQYVPGEIQVQAMPNRQFAKAKSSASSKRHFVDVEVTETQVEACTEYMESGTVSQTVNEPALKRAGSSEAGSSHHDSLKEFKTIFSSYSLESSVLTANVTEYPDLKKAVVLREDESVAHSLKAKAKTNGPEEILFISPSYTTKSDRTPTARGGRRKAGTPDVSAGFGHPPSSHSKPSILQMNLSSGLTPFDYTGRQF